MSAPMEEKKGADDSRTDRFTPSFKFFKRRKPPPDLSTVIDFRNCESNEQVQQVNLPGKHTVIKSFCQSYGLKPVEEWKAFSLSEIPGFMFIQDPYLPGYQRYWIKRCLKDYTKKPNVRNLDGHMTLKDEDCLWDLSQTHLRKAESGDKSKSLIQQLRWVTFGYQHNWDTQLYDKEHQSPFPADLAGMTELIAAALGHHDYKAEAAIVNFYRLDSSLCGHTDHSEYYMDMPLISYSFGQSAIFLVGGHTKEQKPTAMFLHSGDIIIMGGPARLAYHALPRVLPSTDGNVPQCLQSIPDLTSHGSASSDNFDVRQGSSEHYVEGKSADMSEAASRASKLLGTEVQPAQLRTDTDLASGKKREKDETDLESTQSTKLLCTGKSNIAVRASTSTDSSEDMTSDTFDINLELKDLCIKDTWDMYAAYLKCSRINVSVRQVMKPGQGFPEKSE